MSRHTVSVRHNFETAHRLPVLGGKCTNLHGHSWWATVTVNADQLQLPAGMVVEFGAFKTQLRTWIDTWLDHGAMLGADDSLLPALAREGSKVFRFGARVGVSPVEHHAVDLPWPTVEAVATLIGRVATDLIADLAPGAVVSRVQVTETSVNAAGWAP